MCYSNVCRGDESVSVSYDHDCHEFFCLFVCLLYCECVYECEMGQIIIVDHIRESPSKITKSQYQSK